jgi:hypothetical protein
MILLTDQNEQKMKQNTEQHNHDWQVTIAQTFDEIEAIRPIWEQMQRQESSAAINTDIDGYLSIVEANAGNAHPYIILVKEGTTPRAMLIAVRQKLSIPLKLGYLSLFSPRLEGLTVVYDGILGRPSREMCSFLIHKLLDIMRGGDIDTIFFNHLRTDSDFYKTLTTQAGFFGLGRFPKVEPHWAMSMPDTIDQLYQRYSPKNRSNLRRLIRRLEKTYNNDVKVITYTCEDEVEKAIETMVKISARTYQSQLYSVDSKQSRNLLRLAATRGWLRACVLYIDEEPAAFELALRYGRSYFGFYTGFDPKWKQYRIGTVILLKFLESICGDPQAKLFDFGFGDAEYKRSYADIQWQEASVYLFAQRPYPLLINLLHSTTIGVSSGINWILNKTGLRNRIKRLWRNRLEEKASEN